MKSEEEKIKEILEALLNKMGITGEVEAYQTAENFQFTIRTNEAGLLIGEGGQNLIALNHIVKRIGERVLEKREFPYLIDVNEYQKQKAEELKDLARMSAQRVRFFKKEIALDPMTSYERRIVHATLTIYPDIITESQGDEPNRRVVIKPFNL